MAFELPPNPYDVLGVSPSASRQEIAAAVPQAMRRKEYPPAVIARAQAILMDPSKRPLADFMRPILPIVQRWKRFDLSALDAPDAELVPLSDYDGLEERLNELKDLLEDA